MESRDVHWISEPVVGLDDASGFIMQQELISISYENNFQQSIPCVYSVENSMETSQRMYKDDQHGLFLEPNVPLLLSFNQSQAENIVYDEADVPKDCIKRKSVIVNGEKERKKMRMKEASYALDHILAERRRREKLNQRFVALAAIIPGLTKMDKASILGDATKHIKELEKKVKHLEDDKIEIATMNMNPSHDHNSNDCESPISSVENNNVINSNSSEHKLHPHKIKIKICGKEVLLKIHCQNHKGVLAKLVSCIEELHLIINSFSAVPFVAGSSSFLDITVVAQVEEGCFITVEDTAKKLNTALKQSI